jgi:hypothetical protein
VSDLSLHPKLGVNPHLCCCPRCWKDNGELVLIGNRTSIRKCGGCGTKLVGHRYSEPCPKCRHNGPHEEVGQVGERDKIPTGLCADCKKELAEHKAIVDAGGIYFRCKQCGKNGVIRPEAELCKMVRDKMEIPTGPCGIEFQTCKEHGEGGAN